MKNVNLFLCTLCILFSYLSSGQTTTILDRNFEQALIVLGLDDEIDGVVTTSNVSGITTLDVSNKGISNLTGIEAFVGLTVLKCNNNILSNLDVSANTALTLLYCYENDLVNLDVSNNTALTILNCANNILNGLNLDSNTSLVKLLCGGNNIPTLNLSNNIELTGLFCDQNNLTSLDVSQNPELQDLNCFGNNLDILDVANNPALTRLWCYNNSLKKLNVNNNSNLTLLYCSGNLLTSLEVKNGPNAIFAVFNATNNPDLTCIDVDNTNNKNNWVIDPQTGISEECNPDPIQVTFNDDGSLSIEDNSLAPTDDNYELSISGDNLRLSNTIPIAFSEDGIIDRIDPYTIEIPLSSITNGLTIDGKGGNNDLKINAPLPLGDNSLTVKNLRSIVRGNGSINLKALNVTDGDFNITELITIIAIAANFSTNGSLSGKGAIDGNVNMIENSKIKPGNSPGIFNSGNLLLDVGSTFDAEVNGVNPGTAHDQINVTGTVTINEAILNLIGGYENNPCNDDEIILIHNDGTDAIIGTFFNYSEGENVAFGDFEGYITYKGGDGNDVSIVTNTAPSNIDGIVASLDPIGVGTNFDLSADFNDDNLDTVTWYFKSDGDFANDDTAEYQYSGSSIEGKALGSFVFDATQTGVYSVKVKVVDFCGEEAEAKYDNYVVIYDPNGGFVTGGGWFYSHPGNMPYNPSAEGKANFGLVAKYKTGKNNILKLDGNTNFQFKDGDFHFKSSSYDDMSLVISGERKATYRGSGSVNGTGYYDFMVTAVDGEAPGEGQSNMDTFRIKIWTSGDPDDPDDEIYDNELGVAENADANTGLGGGSIVIHKPNGKNSKGSNIATTAEIVDGLELKSWPNPSDSYFNINIKSNNLEDNVEIRVFDMTNKLVYKDNAKPNTVYTFGERLEFGVYIVQVIQSGRSETIRLISR